MCTRCCHEGILTCPVLMVADRYGYKQVADDRQRGCTHDCHTGGSVITSVFGVLLAAFYFGMVSELRSCVRCCVLQASTFACLSFVTSQMAPALSALNSARTAAASVFQVIEEVPLINSAAATGAKPAAAQVRQSELCFSVLVIA